MAIHPPILLNRGALNKKLVKRWLVAIAVMLAFDEATYATGTEFSIDGGLLARMMAAFWPSGSILTPVEYAAAAAAEAAE